MQNFLIYFFFSSSSSVNTVTTQRYKTPLRVRRLLNEWKNRMKKQSTTIAMLCVALIEKDV